MSVLKWDRERNWCIHSPAKNAHPTKFFRQSVVLISNWKRYISRSCRDNRTQSIEDWKFAWEIIDITNSGVAIGWPGWSTTVGFWQPKPIYFNVEKIITQLPKPTEDITRTAHRRVLVSLYVRSWCLWIPIWSPIVPKSWLKRMWLLPPFPNLLNPTI